jgi:hypothetical protein
MGLPHDRSGTRYFTVRSRKRKAEEMPLLFVALPAEDTGFWSSSEWSGKGEFNAWNWNFNTNNANVNTNNKNNNYQVRSFASSRITEANLSSIVNFLIKFW